MGFKKSYTQIQAMFKILNRKLHLKQKQFFLKLQQIHLMEQTDIAEVARIAKKHNVLLIVDNTFYTPLLQQPILQGADIVIHSATKYLGGHNDVLAGLIVAKGEKLCADLAKFHNAAGAVLSPFDSWLLMRGMKTLSLRMERHESNAQKIVQFLENHDSITDVLYPGHGGMVSFRVLDEVWVNPFLQNLYSFVLQKVLVVLKALLLIQQPKHMPIFLRKYAMKQV